MSAEELKARLDEKVSRLAELTRAEDGRVKKRLYQAIGKLKKQLAAVTGISMSEDSGKPVKKNDDGADAAADDKGDVMAEEDAVEGEMFIEKAVAGKKRKRSSEGKGDEDDVEQLSNKKAKATLRLINEDIAQYAQKKQLKLAKRQFQRLVKDKRGLNPDIHTYANMINAHVRCGDIKGAEGYFQSLLKTGKKPNVVVYTAMIKGYGEACVIEEAERLLVEMSKQSPPLIPNLRTVNTFLRGCVRGGHVEAALGAYSKMKTEWKLTPDGTTVEYLTGLLCQDLRIGEAEKLVLQCTEEELYNMSCSRADGDDGDHIAIGSNPAIHVHLVRACALIGAWSKCSAFILTARKCLEAFGSSSGSMKAVTDEFGNFVMHTSAARASTGSTALFLKHRNNELTKEINLMEKYVKRQIAAKVTHKVAKKHYHENLLRVFRFRGGLAGKLSSGESTIAVSDVSSELLSGIDGHFGLRASRDGSEDDGSDAGVMSCLNDALSKYTSFIDSDLHVDFQKVFKNQSASADSTFPVKLEICSGAGEWVASQAKADAGVANWVSLELRTDRVYQTFSKMILEQVPNNLAVLGGDAAFILPNRLRPNSVSQICVNHPEPPERTSGVNDSQGSHLLTGQFFKEMARILQVDGTLTIATDNLAYGKSLIQTVAEDRHARGLFLSMPVDDGSVNSVFGGVTLWNGDPGVKEGYSVEASSYFDRLWEHGDKHRRFFIFLKRK